MQSITAKNSSTSDSSCLFIMNGGKAQAMIITTIQSEFSGELSVGNAIIINTKTVS